MTDPDCIDPAALDRLRQLGGVPVLRQMIGLFLEYVPGKISEALAAERAGDLVGVQKAVHPLRSGSGNVGARAMQDLATRIEHLARDRQPEQLAPLLQELEQSFRQVKSRLEKELEVLNP